MEVVRKPRLPAILGFAFVVSTLVVLPVSSGRPDSVVAFSDPPLPNLRARDTILPMVWIVSTSPADGETDVALNAPIIIVFSDSFNITGEFSLTIHPALGGTFVFTWNYGDTMVTFTHSTPFAECTLYTVFVGGVDPGPVPNPWSFTTTCGPPAPFAPAGNLTLHRRWGIGDTTTSLCPNFPLPARPWKMIDSD